MVGKILRCNLLLESITLSSLLYFTALYYHSKIEAATARYVDLKEVSVVRPNTSEQQSGRGDVSGCWER
jgi:hypothetical protein